MAARTVSNAIRIDGLKELQADLKKLSPATKRSFDREMRGIAREVVDAVRAQMPVKSGAARGSVRVQFAGGYLAVKAGGGDVPYYPWLDFGGTLGPSGRRLNTQHRAFFKEGRWIYPTIARRRPAIYLAGTAAVERAKREAGLK